MSSIFGQILAIFGEMFSISKSITQKILVGGIYGWSSLIRLIEPVSLASIFEKKFIKIFQNHVLLPYILDFENLSKSITRKILVGGIYGWSPLIGLIETVILTPHLP